MRSLEAECIAYARSFTVNGHIADVVVVDTEQAHINTRNMCAVLDNAYMCSGRVMTGMASGAMISRI